jgi:DNA-binding NarL/FixJ family response regulator
MGVPLLATLNWTGNRIFRDCVLISAIIVEDSDIVRALWREMVAKIAGLSLTGEFNRASTAIAAIRRAPPDVVLLDIHLSEGNGIEVLRVVTAEYPMTKVIVVSNCADPIHRRHFTKAGAYAFYDKSHELAALRGTLEHLAQRRSPATMS